MDEDDVSFKVIGRILELEDIREFSRQDGTTGLVRNMTIGDDSGFIAVTLWDDKTNLPYDINEAIKIQNPRINYNDMSNRVELSIGNSTNILQPSYNELTSLPDINELQDILYTSKDIAKAFVSFRKHTPDKYQSSQIKELIAGDYMSANVETISQYATVPQLADAMLETGYNGYPVVDDEDQIIGIVTQSDLLKLIYEMETQ